MTLTEKQKMLAGALYNAGDPELRAYPGRMKIGTHMKATASSLLQQIAALDDPAALPFARAFAHGTMSVELYAPKGHDPQQPHEQDELYIVHTGTGALMVEGARHDFAPGTCLFVPAGADHRFVDFSDDFATWVIFWGPKGGERPA